MEETSAGSIYNMKFRYNDPAAPNNQKAAMTVISSFLCPSNGYSQPDPQGYGQTDYMPTTYTNIDPGTEFPVTTLRMDGALALGQVPMSRISDGTSKTMAIAEDVGKNHESLPPNMISKYVDPIGGGKRANYRWAEPDCGNGVSGPPASSIDKRVINNNKTPLGGPSTCPWGTNNCGPHDEIFSFHPAIANCLFVDGSVHGISEEIDATVVRRLVTRAEGTPLNYTFE
jgi:prepilin-type processing-associated H-X9-DG protein